MEATNETPSPFVKRIGRALRAVRTGDSPTGLTASELAEAAGMSERQVSRLERGNAALSSEHIERLAGPLGYSADGLWAAIRHRSVRESTGVYQ